jgi:hypothetical protein
MFGFGKQEDRYSIEVRKGSSGVHMPLHGEQTYENAMTKAHKERRGQSVTAIIVLKNGREIARL